MILGTAERSLQLVVPDYASVFAGTLLEEVYINSADLSDLRPAVIWALLWKHGGLLLGPDSLMLQPFHQSGSFVALNRHRNQTLQNIMYFADPHHEVPGKASWLLHAFKISRNNVSGNSFNF